MPIALALPRRSHAAPHVLAARLEALALAEQGRLVLWLPVFLGTGVLVYFGLRAEPPAWAGAALALPAGCAAWLGRGWARVALVPVAALAIGFALAQLATLRALPQEALPFRAVVLTGQVAGVEILPEGRRVTVAGARLDDGTALRRRIRVRLRESDGTALATGDTLRVRALLRPPSPPSYPGGWDLQRDAFFAGYAGYGFAIGTSERLARQPPSGLSAWMQHMREGIARRIQARLPGTDGAVAATLMTGVPSAIPEEDREAFRASGLAHLLAVAGLHIGAVMGLAFALTRALLALSERTALFWPTKQVAAGAALAAGGFYMVLTGMHVPIVRSFAMASLVTLAALLGRRAVSVRGLAFAAVALMVAEPQEVPGASFQMSFSAVLALIAGYEALRPWLRRLHGDGALWRRVAGHLVALALTSLLAGGASAPFGAYHFGRLQIYFVIANMIAVPITALWVMPLGLLALALMPLGLEGPALGAMGWGVRAIVLIARNVTTWPLAVAPIPHMPDWGLAVVGLGLAWLGLWRTAWLRLIGLLPLALGLASPWLMRPPDLLVAADGKLIGARAGSVMLVEQAPGASRFTRDAWRQFWAADEPGRLPFEGAAADGRVSCAENWCLLRLRPEAAPALLLRRQAPPDCQRAAVILSLEAARGRCRGPALVDRVTARMQGSVAIWLEPGGARLLTDRLVRGDRPWVPPLHHRAVRHAEPP